MRKEITIENFQTAKQLSRVLRTNEECMIFYEGIRWKHGRTCPKCGCEKHYILSKKLNYRCANRECRKIYNVLTGTVFQNTKLPLDDWFYGIFVFMSHPKGVNSVQLAKELFITQCTAWHMLTKIRKLLKDENLFLEGVIEADETFFGPINKFLHKDRKQKGTQGRSLKTKSAIVGMLERGGRIALIVVTIKLGKKQLNQILRKHIKEGSTLLTDEYTGYANMYRWFERFVVNHKRKEYVNEENPFIRTSSIERFWANLKRGLKGVYQRPTRKYLQLYCHEFEFRFNTRELTERERFEVALMKMAGGAIRYRDVKNEGPEY